MSMKNIILIGFFMLIFGFANVWAEEESPTASTDVAILSKYIWRGQELSRDSIVIQPSMTISYKGFSGNLWGNLDTDQYKDGVRRSWLDRDRSHAFLRQGVWHVKRGSWLYLLRSGGNWRWHPGGLSDSGSWYVPFAVVDGLQRYRRLPELVLLGISHAFEITEKVSLELSGSISYLLSDNEDDYPEIDNGAPTGDEFKNFHDGVISASLPIAVAKYITITPSLSYTFPLSSDASDEMEWRSKKGDDDNFLYGGVTVSMAF